MVDVRLTVDRILVRVYSETLENGVSRYVPGTGFGVGTQFGSGMVPDHRSKRRCGIKCVSDLRFCSSQLLEGLRNAEKFSHGLGGHHADVSVGTRSYV